MILPSTVHGECTIIHCVAGVSLVHRAYINVNYVGHFVITHDDVPVRGIRSLKIVFVIS